MPTKEYVTWDDVMDFVTFVKYYCLSNKPSGVFGIPRGGLILAVLVSHALDIPMLSAPCDNCLIVDDICDSGESLLHYYNNTSGGARKDFRIATMYYKENSLGVKPDYYMKKKADNWIVFPWEGKED